MLIYFGSVFILFALGFLLYLKGYRNGFDNAYKIVQEKMTGNVDLPNKTAADEYRKGIL